MCVCTLLKIYKVLVLNDPFSNLIYFFFGVLMGTQIFFLVTPILYWEFFAMKMNSFDVLLNCYSFTKKLSI